MHIHQGAKFQNKKLPEAPKPKTDYDEKKDYMSLSKGEFLNYLKNQSLTCYSINQPITF